MRKKNTIRLNESTLNRVIKESVKRVLKEMSLHNDSPVYTNNTGDAQPNGDDLKWNYDGDTIDKLILGIKKDAQKEGGSGPNGFPMAHWFAKNYKYYYPGLDYIDNDSFLVFVPDVDEPDYEMTPKELYKTLVGLFMYNQIGCHM